MSGTRTKLRILFSGGGTGGHVQPALAVAEEVLRLIPETTIRYAGVSSPESELVPPEFQIKLFPAVGMPSLRSLKMIPFAWTLLKGVLQAIIYILKFRPHAVFATGGFASAPAVFAAAIVSKSHLLFRRIPIYLFEPNAEPGRMNMMAAKLADRIAVVTDIACHTLNFPNVAVDGYPVRWNFRAVDREEARRALNLPQDAHVVLAFGGSMGARTLNNALVEAWSMLRRDPQLFLLLAVGRRDSDDYHAVRETEDLAQQLGVANDPHFIRVKSFDDMSAVYTAADLVVTRAGAGTIAEICQRGLAAILVPKSNLPGDHQAANAVMMKLKNAMDVVFERSVAGEYHQVTEAINPEELAAYIHYYLAATDRCEELRRNAMEAATPEARRTIALNLIQMAQGHKVKNENLPRSVTELSEDVRMLGRSGTALRSRLERELKFSWNDLLPPRVLDLPERPLPHPDRRDALPLISYYRYRGNVMLSSSSWETRNEGIKLAALACDSEVRPILFDWITDRRPVIGLKRRLGGDFQTVGFLRRNAVAALPALEWWDDEQFKVLRTALDDPYWEVRTAAARALVRLPEEQSEVTHKVFSQLLQEHLVDEKHYEVRTAIWLTLGVISPTLPSIELIRGELHHPNDLVRTGLMQALERMELRGISTDEYADEIQRNLLLTSSQFVPNFQLRRAAARFHKARQDAK